MAAPAVAGTVREALIAATDALAAAGVPSPRLDAELLLAEATAWDRTRLAGDPGAGVTPQAARRFGEMIRRRVQREPLAYIVGRKGFRGIELAVDARVLIPRPETELLVEVALELRPATVLDVGTGSGAVALAVASELPGTEVVATDTSTAALEVAAENVERLGLKGRVRLEPGTVPPGARFDLVLANLPYVRDDEWEGLLPEITRHEPREALVGGPDGLDAIRMLLGELRPGGSGSPLCAALALEVGAGQAQTVCDLAHDAGFGRAEEWQDLAKIDRVVLARR
jgi:release factor glutamine methyltransferase